MAVLSIARHHAAMRGELLLAWFSCFWTIDLGCIDIHTRSVRSAPRRAVTAPLGAGFGANFWGETVGQGIALLEYYRALEAGEVSL